MATDLATIKAILDTRGINYKEAPETRRTHELHTTHEPTGRTVLEVPSKLEPRNTGYAGFFSLLTFSADGTLEQWGTWE